MTRSQFGVISLSFSFLDYLAKEPSVRERIAPLQLCGRFEDYLVGEFMQFVYWRSHGCRYCERNLGKRGEQRPDIAFLRPTPKHGQLVKAFIEAKYFQNRSRRSVSDTKTDEVRSTIRDLVRQLRFQPSSTHGGIPVDLGPRTILVYGLVFASYVCRGKEKDGKEPFFRRVMDIAKEEGLQYHDLPTPYLRPLYEDYSLMIFGEEWRVSLRGALWRLGVAPDPTTEPAVASGQDVD